MADKEDGSKGFATAMAERGSASMAVGKAVLEPVTVIGGVFKDGAKAAAGNESVIRNIALMAGIEGGGDLEDKLGASLAVVARDNGVATLALGKAVEQIMAGGVAYPDALATAKGMAQFSVGQQVAIDDSAKLVTSLNQDVKLPAAEMDAALASIAKFGKDNGIARAELAQALPGLLHDMSRLGLSGREALDQVLSVLSASKASGNDVAGGAKDFHTTVEKLRGQGSEVELAKARETVRNYAPLLPVEKADPGMLAADQQKIRARSESKWAEAGQAGSNLSVSIGDAIRPVSDQAAVALRWLANGAADVVKAFPPLVLGLGTVAAALGGYALGKRTYGALSVGVGKTLEWMGIGKGKTGAEDAKDGSKGVQRVFVTNWRGGGDSGGDGIDLDGRKKRRPLPRGTQAQRAAAQAAARAAAAVPKVGFLGRAWAGTKALGSGVLSARSTVATALNGTPLVKQLAGRIGLLGTVYQGLQLVTTLAGNGSEREKASAIGGAVANVAGAAIGGLLGGPAGAMLGSAAGSAAWGYFGDKVLDWRDTWREKPQPASIVTPAAPAAPAAFVAPNGPKAPVPATVVATAAAIGAAVAVKPAGASGLSAAPDAEAVLRAAATAAAVPAAQAKAAGQGAAALAPAASSTAQAGPPQFNFKPSISITVQGDVREPRRIAEELMPYLRQLFDQYSDQQRRGSMFDLSPVTGEQKWA